MSKNNKSDDKQTKSDEKEKRRRRKRTWKLIRRWAARVGLLLIALLFVLLSLHWFPAELHYKLTETYTFTSDEAATVNLAVLLPRSGPYQIVIEPEILWPGIWELEADGRLDVARFSSQIKPGEAIKAVISYKVHLYQGTADWIGEPVRSPDLIPSGSIQSDAAPLVAQAAILQVENNDQASARNLFNWTKRYLTHSAALEPAGDQNALAVFTAGVGDSTGYANLFAALCRAADIPARIVTGRVLPGLVPLIPFTLNADDSFAFQVWDEIFLQEKWQMADVYHSGSFLVHNLLGWTDGKHLVYDVTSNYEDVYQGLVETYGDQNAWHADGTEPTAFVAWSDSEVDSLAVTPELTIQKTWDGRWVMMLALLLILFIINWIMREDRYGGKSKSKTKNREK